MARVTASTRQIYPVNEPQASIDTRDGTQAQRVARWLPKDEADGSDDTQGDLRGDQASDADASTQGLALPDELDFLHRLATYNGNLIDILGAGTADRLGSEAERMWRLDQGTRDAWMQIAERGFALATQETDDEEGFQRDGPWDGAADIHYPILTTAVTQFNARATPELIKGDKVVGVKTFSPPGQSPSPAEDAKALPPPQNPQQAQQIQGAVQQGEQQESQADLLAKSRRARGQRVAHYLNFLVFYRMDNWEGDTDVLLMEMPISGCGFKKGYMGPNGLASDYVSAMRLTVSNDTKSIDRCPRITQDFDIYPYEIEQGKRAGLYADVSLDQEGDDPERSRVFIEQHMLTDLDEDGVAEPYIITVDEKTKRTLRIEAAFTPEDIVVSGDGKRVIRIERWIPFSVFTFLPDPKGRFYGLGLARLLDAITDSVDTSLNQLIDAGNAEIAGGGFIGSNVRLQGSGQGGSIWFQPGEYKTVSTPGPNLQEAIWERTTPHPSPVTMQMLELLLAAAKDISSVKDVITGDAPSTAPVGTTLALQNQALQVFSAIYKRIYRGFRDEFRIMFHCVRRWATDEMRKEYAELTGGDLDQDFAGDGTDIQPIADPSVVTKMQKIARLQTLMQVSESAVGQAAGMTQPGPAQAIVGEFLDAMEYDQPERFMADVPPNPLEVAKAQDLAATASLKQADAQMRMAETPSKVALNIAKAHETGASTNEKLAKTVETMGTVGEQTHRIHQEADRVGKDGIQPPPEGTEDAGTTPS